MRFCDHRGTKKIGGTCIGIEADGARLPLDLGPRPDADAALHPANEDRLVEAFGGTRGTALVAASAQDLDRMARLPAPVGARGGG